LPSTRVATSWAKWSRPCRWQRRSVSYPAALVQWTDAELDCVHKVWLQVHRAVWRLPPGYASAPLVLHELRQNTINRYRRLCVRCGCHTERELAEHLQECTQCRSTPLCLIARLLQACGQLGVQIKLPAVLSLGKEQRELSWHGLVHRPPLPSLDCGGRCTTAGRHGDETWQRSQGGSCPTLPATPRHPLPPDAGSKPTQASSDVVSTAVPSAESEIAGTA
jgi:hypothetical protein